MSFLTLDGIAWPVAKDKAEKDILEIGYYGTAIDGSFIGTRRNIKRQWKLTTPPLSPSDALALKNLLLGLGHHWSFDTSVYSDKGLTLSSGGLFQIITSSPTPKFGAGCLQIGSGVQVNAVGGINPYAGAFASTFSYVVWFWNGSSWDGYAGSVNQGTAVALYKNGASLGAFFPGFVGYVPASGSLVLYGRNYLGTAQISYFDDLVALPYLARNADLAVWSNAAIPFGALPQLVPGGDLIDVPVPPAVYCYNVQSKLLMASLGDGGGFYDNAETVEWTMREV